MTIVRSLLTVSLFVSFILLWYWTWRKERHEAFAAAARLPLEDDTAPHATGVESKQS
jgi:cbb3-type cytochrome oxidase subunit 3